MNNPHLKSITGTGLDRRFARLLEPATDVRNNQELYEAVAAHGRAVILPFDGPGFDLLPPVTLTPEDFAREWKGD